MDDPEVRRVMRLFDMAIMEAVEPHSMDGMEIMIENDKPILVLEGETVESGVPRRIGPGEQDTIPVPDGEGLLRRADA